jgi:hypothetical protein
MPKFQCVATANFYYTVTADTEKAAQDLLAEQLGPAWGWNLSAPEDIEHPQIEEPTVDFEIDCLGLETVPG